MKKVLKRILTFLLCLMLMAVFYVAVIMGQPQEDEAAPIAAVQDQPLLSPLPSAIFISDAAQMDQILAAFPAPLMHAASGNALTFVQGQCHDVSFEGGLGRIATFTYRTENGDSLIITSIYPARALALLGKGDLIISGTAGQSMAGLRSVRMENETTIRLHAQGPEAIYALTTAKQNSAVLRQLTAALQLSEGTP